MKRPAIKKKLLHEYFSDLGKKSVKARMEKLSPEERKRIGQHAIEVRWAKARARKKAERKEGQMKERKKRAPHIRELVRLSQDSETFGPGYECGTSVLAEQAERARLLRTALEQRQGWVVCSPDLRMMLCLADGRPFIGDVWEARELAELHNLYHVDAREFIRLKEEAENEARRAATPARKTKNPTTKEKTT